MSSSPYLDTILDVMPAIQAKQITDTLSRMQKAGQIRNVDEYSIQLKELAAKINSTVPKPSFSLIPAEVWSTCCSESHNLMTNTMKDDIEAIFLQLDSMGKKLDEHHQLFMKSLLNDLELAISNQEAELKRLGWLADPNNNFSLAISNVFSNSSYLRIDRSEALNKGLYFDNRTFSEKTEQELPSAVIDIAAKKLVLKSNRDRIYPIAVKQLADNASYGNLLSSESDSNINNIIDGTDGTYWRRDIYLESPVTEVSTVLQFDLGTSKLINYISGKVGTVCFIKSIKGIKNDNSIVDILTEEIEIENSSFSISFNSLFVKSFIITFSDKTYEAKDFYKQRDRGLFDLLYNRKLIERGEFNNSIGPIIKDSTSSTQLSNLLNIPNEEKQLVSACLYSFMIDNVWVGDDDFVSAGIFVSSPIKVQDIGTMAVNAIEQNVSGANANGNSIEYEIIKIDNYPNYSKKTFSIPRLSQREVYKEKLVLVSKTGSADINDTGKLRFFPQTGDGIGPVIYENDVVLTVGEDFVWINGEEHTGYNTVEVPVTFPAAFYIRITKPKVNATYSASYSIQASDLEMDSSNIFLDEEATILLKKDGIVEFNRPLSPTESKLYLQITLRRDRPENSSSPALSEYTVLASQYN